MLVYLTAVIIIVIFQETHAGSLCPAQWISYENYCYMYNTTRVPYWDARRQCQARGADLTTMVNAQETEALAEALKSIPGKMDLWIGLYRLSEYRYNTAFKWTDGTGFDSSQANWYGNEPGYGDQYGRLYRSNGTEPVKWAAARPIENSKLAVRGYICKKETWNTSMQNCFDGKCYRISSAEFDKDQDAKAECAKYNMTVLEYGTFPDALNSTFGVNKIPEDYFWTEYGNITERRQIHNGPLHSTSTTARIVCTGPVGHRCPCGWHEYGEYCYYTGRQSEKKNKSDARAHCESMDAMLANVVSHTENLFIQSLLNLSQTYWINNRRNAPYCWYSQDECEDNSVISGNGTWIRSDSSEQHHVSCKKKKEKDRKPPVDFCIIDHPRECYIFPQTTVALRNLRTVNCGQDMKILNEEMLQERRKYLFSYLAKAINSPTVTCASYWIDRKGTGAQIIAIKNDTVEVSSQVDSPVLAAYICVQDIDECASFPCMNGGKCEDALHNYNCICVAGYTGEQCETDIDECASDPCQHGSSCYDVVNRYFCICKHGYSGINCETDIASDPCQHGSSCYDEVNRYFCICEHGYTGTNCETASKSVPHYVIGILSLLGIAVIVIIILACRLRMIKTPSDGDHGNTAQDEHTYYEITPGLGSGNPPVQLAREEPKGASAGKGIQLKAVNKKILKSDEVVKACANVEENDGYLAPRAFPPPNFGESAEYEDVENFGKETENTYLEVIG